MPQAFPHGGTQSSRTLAAIALLLADPTGPAPPSLELFLRKSHESGLRGPPCAVNWHLHGRSLQAGKGRRSEVAMTEVTRILSSVERGDNRAAEQLLPLVYDELR